MITNIIKDKQSITHTGKRIVAETIEGLYSREVPNIIKANGMLTELFRSEWFEGNNDVSQVFKVTLEPGAVSAWHMHKNTFDRICILYGSINLVVFDGRENSSTAGVINQFYLSEYRPLTVVIPPGVWHGIQNIYHGSSSILNIVNVAYEYEDPDHWRIPMNDPQIPYTFK